MKPTVCFHRDCLESIDREQFFYFLGEIYPRYFILFFNAVINEVVFLVSLSDRGV